MKNKKDKIPESLDFTKITWIDNFATVFERDLVESIERVKIHEQMNLEPKAIAEYLMLQLNILYKIQCYDRGLKDVYIKYFKEEN